MHSVSLYFAKTSEDRLTFVHLIARPSQLLSARPIGLLKDPRKSYSKDNSQCYHANQRLLPSVRPGFHKIHESLVKSRCCRVLSFGWHPW